MLDCVRIKNFKSIVNLEFNLGRINIFIGANGCGKTNILEAIAIASAANQNKLDNEYLGTRLRMTGPDFFLSGFDESGEVSSKITITVSETNRLDANIQCVLFHDSKTDKWVNESALKIVGELVLGIEKKEIYRKFDDISKFLKTNNVILHDSPRLDSYLIFSPEETNLRKFSDDTMIRPLGRRGEGMFQHLKELLTNGNKEEIIHALNKGLYFLDWFKGFSIPTDLFTQEARLDISDRFLKEAKQVFDQRSTNEGFLYLLFYLTLFNSPQTPSFFAIDNIENSLNPKLLRRLLQHFTEVAKKTDKQVIITTHSPYVLDGLDLSDDEQRLFIVRRNIDGHTKVSRIPHKENRTLPLSEIWMSGVLGGLPDNF